MTTLTLFHVTWQGSFVSSGNTRLLSLRRSTLEAKLGPLQNVIDQAGARVAKGEALKERNEGLAASLKVGSSSCVLNQVRAPCRRNYFAELLPCGPKFEAQQVPCLERGFPVDG